MTIPRPALSVYVVEVRLDGMLHYVDGASQTPRGWCLSKDVWDAKLFPDAGQARAYADQIKIGVVQICTYSFKKEGEEPT